MNKNRVLFEAAQAALNQLYRDPGVSVADTREMLSELRDEITVLLDALIPTPDRAA